MKKDYIRKITLTAVFAAIICVAAPFPIPIGPVPITLSLFAVFLCGSVLPPFYAATATLVYIALGTVGLPVFSNFEAGIGKLIGPTGGFLWSYPFMVLVIALSVKLFKKRNILSLAVGILTATFICYTMGTLWFSHLTGNSINQSIAVCVLPFIPADLIKGAATIAVTIGLEKTGILKKRN
jgi:biotin transport system substrate-specific component